MVDGLGTAHSSITTWGCHSLWVYFFLKELLMETTAVWILINEETTGTLGWGLSVNQDGDLPGLGELGGKGKGPEMLAWEMGRLFSELCIPICRPRSS